MRLRLLAAAIAMTVSTAGVAARAVSPAALSLQTGSMPLPIADDDFAKGAYRPGPEIQAPVATKRIAPQYSRNAAYRDISGEVVLDAVVGADGKVTRVRIAHSIDSKYGLDDAAKNAVKQWMFAPGRLKNVPVPCLVTVTVEFRNPLYAPAEFAVGAVSPREAGVTQPVLRHKSDPRYTSEAMHAKVQGEVWLDAVVDVDGSVKVLGITRSLDKETGLDYAAVQASKDWRFEPATRNGQPVKFRIVLIMEFRLH